MLRRAVRTSAGVLGAASAGAAYVYRPVPWEDPPRDPLINHAEEDEGFLMGAARLFTFAAGTTTFTVLMHVLNKGERRLLLPVYSNTPLQRGRFDAKRDAHYEAFVEAVVDRPPGVPLLTVANHASTLDDPAIFVGMLPARMTLRPHLMRWTMCAQEICFKAAATQAALGAGKALPISRGGGIDQPLLLNFYRRLAAGEWCHIFPEGRCEQDGSLGGRAPGPNRDALGRLKWGVGKMIAHAPVAPIVIPVYHTGMANIMPLNPMTRKILHALPRSGNTITARAGAAIEFDDLLREHESRHGPLRKLSAAGGARVGDRHAEAEGRYVTEADVAWVSSSAERQLYSRIAMRVEKALLQLEEEARRDLGEDYPGLPPESERMLRLSQEAEQ